MDAATPTADAASDDAGTEPDAATPTADGGSDAGPVECTSAADCDDGAGCNGAEECVDEVCVAGQAITCTPSDACHTTACVEPGSCTPTLIDADGDGFAPSSLGACGSDCDDTNEAIHPDAAEIVGDEIDQNCDGNELCYRDSDHDLARDAVLTVESVGDLECTVDSFEATDDQPIDCNEALTHIHPGAFEITGSGVDEDCDGHELCFADADRDGFRAGGNVFSEDADCSDLGEAPLSAGEDCCDSDSRAFPGQDLFFTTGQGARLGCGGWDFNCDGREEPYPTGVARCTQIGNTPPTCRTDSAGWRTSVPPCGTVGQYVANCTTVSGTCSFPSAALDQECR